ncbi:MAG: DNA polymerase I, partial [Spirochaetes bacterium]|nr:DNA polymerase I [Spirochaetota bacterium]
EKASVPDLRSEDIRNYFDELEMNSIVKEIFGEGVKPVKKEKAPVEKNYIIIKKKDELKKALELVRKAGEMSVDTETTSLDPVEADLVGISFSIKENEGWFIPVISTGGMFGNDYIDKSVILKMIKPVLEDPGIKKIGQNIKFDMLVFMHNGIEVKGVYFDTLIAAYLINTSEGRYNMDILAEKYLDYKTITYDELVGTGRNKIPITGVPLERLAEYAIEDADVTYRLYKIFKDKLAVEKLEKLFYELEMPLVSVLARMEWNGVKIDIPYFGKLLKENQKLLMETEDNIYKLAGQRFNINSTRELAFILFDKLSLKPVRKTKTGFSTDIKVLETLMGQHEIIEYLVSYRTLSKLKSTYIEALPQIVSQKTGRIHTSYNQTFVATGRLSSSNPNLQNIPVRDEFGKKIRRAFIPEKGCMLMSADYSQIELRLAAHLSKDKNMLKAFTEKLDIHNLTASSVFGVAMDKVTPDMRRQAKIINFSTIYGVSPYGLSQQADLDIHQAAEFIKKYFETYPGFREYIDATVAFAREHGYVETLMGRRRPVPEIDASVSFRREGAERIAINTPIQGTSADLIKIAMVNIQRVIDGKGYGSKMIMQVHDELVFEVPEPEREIIEKLVRKEMEGAMELMVPLVVDIAWGANWDEAH